MDKFEEYKVVVSKYSGGTPVVLFIWAKSLEDAMTCGEILSAIYLSNE